MSGTLRFTVPGIARTKGSTRPFIVKRKVDGKSIVVTTNDNRKAKGWQHTIAALAAEALASSGLSPFLDGAIVLDVWLYFPRPKKYLTKKFAHVDVPMVTRPDHDKALRLVSDALSHVVWRDDTQVVDAYCHKRYVRAGDIPRAEITVRAVTFELPKPIVHSDTPLLFSEEALYGEAR